MTNEEFFKALGGLKIPDPKNLSDNVLMDAGMLTMLNMHTLTVGSLIGRLLDLAKRGAISLSSEVCIELSPEMSRESFGVVVIAHCEPDTTGSVKLEERKVMLCGAATELTDTIGLDDVWYTDINRVRDIFHKAEARMRVAARQKDN